MPKTSTVLFDKASVENYSPAFYLNNQVTIYATGLAEGDEIRFELIRLSSGTPAMHVGCFFSEINAAEVDGIQQLNCTHCEVHNVTKPVRVTAKNPFIVLDHPKESLLRAVYVPGDPANESLGTMQVWATENRANVEGLTDAMRGCEPTCCEEWPLEDWLPSEEWRCNLETDMEERKFYGHCHGYYDWREVRPIRWIATGVIECDERTHEILIQEVNRCGDLRWRPHETETCGWYPTYEIPSAGLGFRPTDDRDPVATVEVADCEGNILFYLYPTASRKGDVPVLTCEGEVLGYSLRSEGTPYPSNHTPIPTRNAVHLFSHHGKQYVLRDDGTYTPIHIPLK